MYWCEAAKDISNYGCSPVRKPKQAEKKNRKRKRKKEIHNFYRYTDPRENNLWSVDKILDQLQQLLLQRFYLIAGNFMPAEIISELNSIYSREKVFTNHCDLIITPSLLLLILLLYLILIINSKNVAKIKSACFIRKTNFKHSVIPCPGYDAKLIRCCPEYDVKLIWRQQRMIFCE